MKNKRQVPGSNASGTAADYPSSAAARTQWVLAHREPRRLGPSPWAPAAVFVEKELAVHGKLVDTLTVLVVSRECPWRCVYCDLWKQTLPRPTPPGAVTAQLEHALRHPDCKSARQIKLYNAGSFFDAGAIPPNELPGLAGCLRGFERVIVECHPSLVGDAVLRFRDALAPAQLEVAMGLEIANPQVLERLNKRMTLDDYAAASALLRREGVAIRTFVMVQPPFLPAEEAVQWAAQSVAFAVKHGASVVCLIPTRPGNGPLRALAEMGCFTPPSLETLEVAWEAALAVSGGRRVFCDSWDLEQFSRCPTCFERRARRLQQMNHAQALLPRLPVCVKCGWGGA